MGCNKLALRVATALGTKLTRDDLRVHRRGSGVQAANKEGVLDALALKITWEKARSDDSPRQQRLFRMACF